MMDQIKMFDTVLFREMNLLYVLGTPFMWGDVDTHIILTYVQVSAHFYIVSLFLISLFSV